MITIEPFTFQVVDQHDEKLYAKTLDDAQALRTDCLTLIEQGKVDCDYAKEQLAALLGCSSAIHSLKQNRVWQGLL